MDLLRAVQGGRIDEAKVIIKAGADLNTQDQWGNSALHYASNAGHPPMVAFLLGNNADPSSKSKDGLTPVHLAAARGHETALKLLVQHGADINHADNHGRTALMISKEQGHRNLEATILELLKSLSSPTRQQQQPQVATSPDPVAEVRFSPPRPSHKNNTNNNTNTNANAHSSDEAVDQPVTNNSNTTTNTISEEELEKLRLQKLQREEEKKLEIQLEKQRIEQEELQRQQLYEQQQRQLIEDAQKQLALEQAVEEEKRQAKLREQELKDQQELELAKQQQQLIKASSAPNTAATLDLFDAVRHEDMEKLNTALSNDSCDLKAMDEEGQSSLHIASSVGNMAILKLLIVYGASPDQKSSKTKSTSLHLAAENGNLDVAEFLVGQYGVPLAAADIDGRTALHLASLNGHLGLVQLLLERCGSVKLQSQLIQSQDACAFRAVALAEANNREKVVEALTRAQAMCEDLNTLSSEKEAVDEYLAVIVKSAEAKRLEAVFSTYVDIQSGALAKDIPTQEQMLLSLRVFLAFVRYQRKFRQLGDFPDDDCDTVELTQAALTLCSSRKERDLDNGCVDQTADAMYVNLCMLAARAIAEEFVVAGVLIPGAHDDSTRDETNFQILALLKAGDISQKDASRMMEELTNLDQFTDLTDALPSPSTTPTPVEESTGVADMFSKGLKSLQSYTKKNLAKLTSKKDDSGNEDEEDTATSPTQDQWVVVDNTPITARPDAEVDNSENESASDSPTPPTSTQKPAFSLKALISEQRQHQQQ